MARKIRDAFYTSLLHCTCLDYSSIITTREQLRFEPTSKTFVAEGSKRVSYGCGHPGAST